MRDRVFKITLDINIIFPAGDDASLCIREENGMHATSAQEEQRQGGRATDARDTHGCSVAL